MSTILMDELFSVEELFELDFLGLRAEVRLAMGLADPDAFYPRSISDAQEWAEKEREAYLASLSEE